MKISINLLPPEPEAEAIKKKKRTAIFFSEVLLAIFLLINLGIFGFYWFFTKSTANTLEAIKREETTITSLQPKELVYRALCAKLSFLSTLWQKNDDPVGLIDFTQGFPVPKVSLVKISLKEDGQAALSLKTTDSEGLENFLNTVSEKEKNKQIKDIKLTSTSRNEEGGYDFSLSFKFLGTK